MGVDVDRLRENILASDEKYANDEALAEEKVKETLRNCDERIASVIRKRVDAMGTNEPVIQSLPKKHQLLVQLPGADEKLRKQAKARLQDMAFLEFRLTHPDDEKLIEKLMNLKDDPEGYEKVGRVGYKR